MTRWALFFNASCMGHSVVQPKCEPQEDLVIYHCGSFPEKWLDSFCSAIPFGLPLVNSCNALSLESCRVSSNSRVMCIVLVNVAPHSRQENSFSGFRVLGLG